MPPYFLALPLPPTIRRRLASLCFGLPHVQWVEEENFHLTLRYFGPLPDQIAENIQEYLKPLFFQNFSLLFKGISPIHSKKNRGSIWVGVEENPFLLNLKKQIDELIKNLHLPAEERPFLPHISLGKYDRINSEKLFDYLSAYGEFRSEQFEIDRCLLMSSYQTPKHLYYKIVEEFPASIPATGDD